MHAAIRFLPLAVLLASCGNKVSGPDGEGVVWTGYNYTWDLLSHRLALNEVTLEADGSLSLALIGGDWSTGSTFSDVPTYRMSYQNISSRGLIIEHGSTELLVGPDGLATESAAITNSEILDMERSVVVLRGYSLDTDIEQGADYPDDYDPALGYTTRGFGFSLSELDASGSFDVEAALRWGPQDRADMNGAILYAQTAVVVSWTVIGFSGELTAQSISSSVDYAWDPPYGGVYLRRFGLEVVQDAGGLPQYAIADGTNSSAFEEIAITFTASADLVWVELADRDATVEVVEMTGTHEVGAATVAAP